MDDHSAESGHGHDHGPNQGHEHAHEHEEEHGHGGLLARVRHVVTPHSHDSAEAVDSALEASEKGIRALLISLAVLGVTAALQAVVVVLSGSVALLGDTLHNVADALTAVPLRHRVLARPPAADPPLHLRLRPGRGPRRRRHRRDHRGLRALAGVRGGRRRLLTRSTCTHLLGGRRRGGGRLRRQRDGRPLPDPRRPARSARPRWSPTGCTPAPTASPRWPCCSARAASRSAGDWADPVVGLLITVAILFVLRDAAREVYRRLMDAVDPALVDEVEQALRATDGRARRRARCGCAGSATSLRAECDDRRRLRLTVVDGAPHRRGSEHRLLHDVPRLTAATVHADPARASARADRASRRAADAAAFSGLVRREARCR